MKWTAFILILGLLNGCGFSAVNSASINSALDVSMSSSDLVVAYDGGGSVSFLDSALILQPMTSTSSSETHAALVLLKETQATPVRDFELIVDVEVVRQLRENSTPNPWEVFWLFFSYNPVGTSDKTTNYFLSKPQVGAELGLAYDQVGQTFLSNEASAQTAVGERHVFKYRRVQNTFTVYRDGLFFYSYTDAGEQFYDKGALGFYTEDAEVKIYSVQYTNLDNVL